MKVIKWLDKNFEKYVLLLLLVAMVCVMTYAIFMRYALNSPPSWSNGLTQYMLVISTFFSISYCIRRKSNLRIDMLAGKFPKSVARILNLVSYTISLLFFALLTYASFGTVQSFVTSGATDTALNIPMYFLFSFTFVGFLITTIRCIQAIVFEFYPEKTETAEN